MSRKVALAIGAHPDDIEIMMAGTLLRLGEAGYELHMMNIANGDCGTFEYDKTTIAEKRLAEARAAAAALGATHHDPVVSDVEVLYTVAQLRRVTAVVRETEPAIMLVQPPSDYMEDHQNACRLAVSAAFTRGMPNFFTLPARPPVDTPVTLYHALPYGLCDAMRRRVRPGQYVDIGPVLARKRAALAEHRTQKEWLDHSQGLDSYLNTMEAMGREVGRWSGRFAVAEGWRRHSHLGFCEEGADPLTETLGDAVWIDEEYERGLWSGLPPAG